MDLKTKLKSLKDDPMKKTRIITFVTMVYNFFWAISKIVFGFFKFAYLYCVSGIYTLLFGVIKRIFINNHNKNDIKPETKSTIMGILILIAGMAFGLYMGSLFIWPRNESYGLIWSIAIALCSFVELGISIYNLFAIKKKNDILLFSLRCCNFVSALFAIVMTQVAILSAVGGDIDYSTYNAVIGIIMSALAILVGSHVIIKSDKQRRQKQPTIENTENPNNEDK